MSCPVSALPLSISWCTHLPQHSWTCGQCLQERYQDSLLPIPYNPGLAGSQHCPLCVGDILRTTKRSQYFTLSRYEVFPKQRTDTLLVQVKQGSDVIESNQEDEGGMRDQRGKSHRSLQKSCDFKTDDSSYRYSGLYTIRILWGHRMMSQ